MNASATRRAPAAESDELPVTAKLANPTTTIPAPSSKRLRRAARRVRSIPTHDQSTAAPPATTTQETQLLSKRRFSRTAPLVMVWGAATWGLTPLLRT